MAAKKKNRNNKAWMIPEGESRSSASHHFVHPKTLSQLRDGKILRMRKYHQASVSMFGLSKQRCLHTANECFYI